MNPRNTQTWAELDPHATNYIAAVQLAALVAELDPPLGVSREDGARAKLQSIMMSVDIPVHSNGKVHFIETLHALAGQVAGTDVPEEEESNVRAKLQQRLPSAVMDGTGQGDSSPAAASSSGAAAAALPRTQQYTVAHYYAALYVGSAIRGFLQRHRIEKERAGQQQQKQQQLVGNESQ